MDTENPTFHEQFTLLNSAAILQLSKKVDNVMSAFDNLKSAEESLSLVINDAVNRIHSLEEAIKAVPPTNEAAIEEVTSRLAGLRDMLAAAVYAPPAPPEVVPPVEPVVEPEVGPNGAAITPTAAIE